MSRTIAVLTSVGVAGVFSFLSMEADVRGQEKAEKKEAPAAAPQKPEPAEEPKDDGELSDSIRFPKDSKVQKSLEAAEDFVKEKDWAQATTVLQTLLDRKEDVFVRVKRKSLVGKTETHWASVRAEANRLLGTMPPQGLEVYELQYGPKAKELLDEAKKSPEERGLDELKHQTSAAILAELAQRYRHTKAGAEAASLLGTHYLLRGEFAMAALCFDNLLNKGGADPTPQMLLKAAIAYQRVGDKNKADQTWKRLTKLSPAGVQLGERKVPLEDIAKEMENLPSQLVALSAHDWPMFKGNISRSAQGNGDTAFLDEETHRWAQPTIREKLTEQWVEQAVRVQESGQKAIIPAFHPIAAGGKLVFRSYFGIHAVDVKTGKLQWEQDSSGSLDRLVSDAGKMGRMNDWVRLYLQAGQNIFFENSTLGTLSTDNNLVYAVDDAALPPHPIYIQQFQMGGGRMNLGKLEEVNYHNKLTAIELKSGKIKWQIGGYSEPNTPPKGEIDNTFFLGAPLPLGGKLYALTEQDSNLVLVCLDAATGRLSWKQTLAQVQTSMREDVGRRIHAANLAYGEGVLVCPTNAGAVLGVDLLTHSLVWVHPYREEKPQPKEDPNWRMRRQMMMMGGGYDPNALASEWKCAAPVIQDGKVLLTAPDGASIHCVNLRDGTLLWKVGRDEDLYLGGVYGGKVLLVGKGSCRALSLADGKLLWKQETGLPSGMGVASDAVVDGLVRKVYYLPLKAGAHSKEPEICAIDIDAGRIIAHNKSRKKEIPGNLIFYEGKVVSQTVTNVTAYPQLKAKLGEITARIEKDPKDPLALTERAELHRNRGQMADAIVDLRVALANNPNADIQNKAKKLLFESLTEYLQRDFSASEKYLDDYKELCKSADPQEQRRRQADLFCIVAKGREQQGKLVEAFQAYKEFAALSDKTSLLTSIDEPAVKTRPDVWVQGRLAAMIAKATPEQRKPLEEEVVRQWKEIQDSADTAKLRDFAAAFGAVSTVGQESRLRLGERLMEENAFLEAELLLLQVRRADDPQLAGRAVETLARLMTRKGLMEDAVYWYRLLGTDFAKTVIRDGKTGAEFFNDRATDKRFLPYLDGSKFPAGKLQAKEEPGANPAQQPLFRFEPDGEVLPFLQQHRLAYNPATFQVKLIHRNGEERWSQNVVPQNNLLYLNEPNHANGSLHLPYRVQGHVAVFRVGVMAYCLDLAEHKVLWQRNLLGEEATQPIFRIIPNPQGGLSALFADGRLEKLGQTGPFEADSVCLLTRQGLIALDPLKNTVLWSRSDVSTWNHVFGDGQNLYLIEVRPDGSFGAGRAVRASDGVTVSIPDFSPLFQRRLRIYKGGLLLTDATPHATVLRLYDIATGKDVWKKEFSANALVLGCEEPDLVGVVEPKNAGKLTVFDLRTRNEVFTGAVDPKDFEKAQSAHLLQDHDHFYVAVNDNQNPQNGPWINILHGFRGVTVNGKLYAFERASGKKKWDVAMSNQILLLDQFKEMPILLFASRFVNGGPQTCATKSLEKETGKVIYEKTQPNAPQYHSLNVNPQAGTIELVHQGMKVRHFVEK